MTGISEDTPHSAGAVDIGGRALYLEWQGSGGPTVILESGYGHSGLVWQRDVLSRGWGPAPEPRTTVFDGVAAFTRVVLYDRPGTVMPGADGLTFSRSDPAPMPRTAAALVDDLHAALTAAELTPPYVFVGHSLGGLLGRLFDARHPGEIAGMVMVDAFSPELWAGLEGALTPDEWAAMRSLEEAPRAQLQAIYPDAELLDLDTLSRVEASLTLSPMRLVVLTRGRPLSDVVPAEAVPAGFRWDVVERVAAETQAALARLSPDARQVVVPDSGHLIQLDRPDVVIAAIREVVDAVRAR